MHVVQNGRVVDLSDLSDGSIFFADFADGPTIRAMKAVYMMQSGIRAGKVVTVGPFLDQDDGKPAAYEPHIVRQSSVVDLTGGLTFRFSIDPEHLDLKLPLLHECIGLAILVGGEIFLGCRFYQGDGLWEPAYLNVATGEIVFQLDAAKACVSRQWTLRETA